MNFRGHIEPNVSTDKQMRELYKKKQEIKKKNIKKKLKKEDIFL